MRTGIVADALFARHLTGQGHPERPERFQRCLHKLRDLDLVEVEPRDATPAELATVHAPSYVDALSEPVDSMRRIDADTVMSPETYAAAVRAAGSVLALGEALLAGTIEAGFACVRPPGHHAGPARAMGFCFFNNIAILARMLDAAGRRVCILDWDVHHGNGTQEVFEADARVAYCSLHQYPHWPGTGGRDETGAGNIFNIPMPPGAGDRQYFEAFDRQVLPWLDDCDPDVLLISAGFDAHRADPLADQNLSTEAFAAFTRKVLGRPILSVLEGGYDLDALGASARAHVQALIDAPTSTSSA